MTNKKNSIRDAGQKLLREKVIMLLLIMVIAMSFVSPLFMTFPNVINILTQASFYGIIACGMTVALIGGEFDLSVGAVASLSGVITAMLLKPIGIVPAILCALLIGAAIGIINGLLITIGKINGFITTLAAMTLYTGVSMVVSNGTPVQISNETFINISNGSVFGIPYPAVICAVIIALTHWMLTRTRFGRNLFAMGGNYQVAKLTGVRVRFYKASVFAITSFTASIAGVLLASSVGTANPNTATDACMYTVSAVVIGGSSMAGGKGSMLRTIIGILILGVLSNAMALLNIEAFYQTAIKGIILIAVVATDSYSKKRKAAAA